VFIHSTKKRLILCFNKYTHITLGKSKLEKLLFYKDNALPLPLFFVKSNPLQTEKK